MDGETYPVHKATDRLEIWRAELLRYTDAFAQLLEVDTFSAAVFLPRLDGWIYPGLFSPLLFAPTPELLRGL